MPYGFISTDPGRAPLLNLRDLTPTELVSLVDTLRDAKRATEDAMLGAKDFEATARMWHELCLLRLEVRSSFLAKFFSERGGETNETQR